MPNNLPAHSSETVPWNFRKTLRGVSSYSAAVPPRLANLDLTLSDDLADASRTLQRSIAAFDAISSPTISILEPFLIRTEAIASSQIEEEITTVDQLARVEAGRTSSAKARTVYGASEALQKLVSTASSRALELADVLGAYRSLMGGDVSEHYYAGKLRDVQNWIGGPNAYPVGADYVPPQPDRLRELMDDLLTFLSRTDIDPLMQAAVGHAQFESIHPFTDGNGRIGRSLINGVLRFRNVTRTVSVPIAAALTASREEYFQALITYRSGEESPIVRVIAEALQTAVAEARRSDASIAGLPARWKEQLLPRAGSATAKALNVLLAHPILDVDDITELTGVSESAAYRAIDQLESAGVLRRVVQSRRNGLWVAGEVLDEADNLIARIAAGT